MGCVWKSGEFVLLLGKVHSFANPLEWFKISQDKIKAIEYTPQAGGATTVLKVRWENTGNHSSTSLSFNVNTQDKTDSIAVEFMIPKSLPNGEYLFRVEHIGLHGVKYDEAVGGGPQFFVSCAHLLITDGATGTPEPLVEFPGEYKRGAPGFLFDPYNTSLTWVRATPSQLSKKTDQ